MNYLNKRLNKGLVAGALLAVSGAVAAFPVTLESVSGAWVDPQGGSYVNGVGTNEIFWGKDVGYGQSGYRFDGAAPPSVVIGDSSPFVLGSMTHINKPIGPDAIEGVSLDVMAGFSTGGGTTDTGPYTFSFTHVETPNVAPVDVSYCKLWLPIVGCIWTKTYTKFTGDVDDIVILDEMVNSSEFQLGNSIFSLSLIGFEGDIKKFYTEENAETSINLLAKLNVRSAQVPEPGTLALLGLGLAGLGLSRRRRS